MPADNGTPETSTESEAVQQNPAGTAATGAGGTAAAQSHEHHPHPRERTAWRRAIIFGLLGSLIVGVLVLAFTWPAKTAEPRNLPIAITGSNGQVKDIEDKLAERSPDLMDFHRADSREDAVRMIEQREVYGGIVLKGEDNPPEILTAPAASPAAATMLNQFGQQLQTQISEQVYKGQKQGIEKLGDGMKQMQAKSQEGTQQAVQAALEMQKRGMKPEQIQAALEAQAQKAQQQAQQSQGSQKQPAMPDSLPQVEITQVVPLVSHDPNGAGLSAASFPLALGGMTGGILISLLVTGAWRRIGSLVTISVTAGLILTLIMHTWFGFVGGSFWLMWLAISLTVAATASFIVGAVTLLGTPGIGLGALVTILLGNPIAGVTSPPEFLPWIWGKIGQFMVPGAGNSLVRDLSYFPDAPMTRMWLVLSAWFALGILLTLAGKLRLHRARKAAARSGATASAGAVGGSGAHAASGTAGTGAAATEAAHGQAHHTGKHVDTSGE